jgi:NAD(P)-dependent dehydrogenase (short-subunit alcohol dehydrogenase family)
MTTPIKDLNLEGKVAVITGGGGVICSVMSKALAMKGVKTAILDLKKENADKVADEIREQYGTKSIGFAANV